MEKDEVFDYYQEVARSAFADMLFDTERNRLYSDALKQAIEFVKSQGKKANVLDIGTGSGLLCMLAARHGADSVVTIEAFSPTSIVARKVIEVNGFKDKIKMISKHSTEVRVGKGEDMEQKANILVAEVLDTELIGEGALRTYNEAHEHLLESDCISVPHSAQVYIQIVDSKLAASWFKPEEFSIHGTQIKIPSDIKDCRGLPSIHDIQLSQFPLGEFKSVTEPIKICEFNFAGNKPIFYEESFSHKFKALERADSAIIFFWWSLHMNTSGSILLSCAPHWNHPSASKSEDEIDRRNSIPWRDHWMQGVYYIPKKLATNEEYTLTANHDEFSWFFDIHSQPQVTITRPSCKCVFHMCSRNRIMQINDEQKRFAFMEMMTRAELENVLFIGDHSLLSLIAAHLSNAQSISVYQEDELFFKNLRKLIEFNELGNKINLTSDLKQINKISHVIVDPYFNRAVLPLDNITETLKIITKLRGLQPKPFKVSPSKAIIYAIPVHFLHLYKIRWPLESSCEGFDHKCFDKVIELASKFADENVEAFSLWEYPSFALGKAINILEVDFNEDRITENHCTSLAIEDSSKSCNGIAFWTEWLSDTDDNIISTGPSSQIVSIGELISWKFDRQAVHLIPHKDIVRGILSEIKIKLHYDKNEQNISYDFSYNYK